MKVSCTKGGSTSDAMYISVYLSASEMVKMTGHSFPTHGLRGTIRSEEDGWFSLKLGKEGDAAVNAYPNVDKTSPIDPNRNVCGIKTLARHFDLSPPYIPSMNVEPAFAGQKMRFKLPTDFYTKTQYNGKVAMSEQDMATHRPLEALKVAIAKVNEMSKKIVDDGLSEVKLIVADNGEGRQVLKASITHIIEL